MNVRRRPRLSRSKARLLTALAAAALATLLALSGLTWRMDAWAFDTLNRLTPLAADERILVVAIDEKSLVELGRWPWSRRVHARLVDKLAAAGTRGVALDVLLSEPALFDPEGDALLARALSSSGKVVLPVYAEAGQRDGPTVELMPIPEFAASAAALGHVDMSADADGVARSMYLRAGLGSAHWPSLALALAQLGDEMPATTDLPGLRMADPEDASPHHWVRDHRVLLPYTRAAGAFRRVSYSDVLNGRVSDAELRGRWIVVGITAAGMASQTATPGTPADARAMLGVDYQANALNMLVHDDAIVPLTPLSQVLLSIALAMSPLLLFGLPRLRTMGRSAMAALLLVPVIAYLLLHFGRAWFPPLSAMSVIAIGGVLLFGRMWRQIRRQAQSDPLTGLANRSRLDDELEQELRSARRNSQPLSLMLLDVDHFKLINDSLGQPAGDEVLRVLSAVLRGRARRPRDLVARMGSDEFAVLLPETTAQAAAAIATTIHVDVANLSTRSGADPQPADFTVSIGIHTCRGGDEVVVEEMFERADAALYQAKQAGRNRSCSHTSESGFASG